MVARGGMRLLESPIESADLGAHFCRFAYLFWSRSPMESADMRAHSCYFLPFIFIFIYIIFFIYILYHIFIYLCIYYIYI